MTTSSMPSTKRFPRLRKLFLLIFLAIVLCPIIQCFVIPRLTGQVCIDFVSGHIPAQAEAMFLKRTLATMSSGYQIIGGDDLAGYYERTLRLDDGTIVRLTFSSVWPSCPDFYVTEEEVSQNVKLDSLKIVSKAPNQ